MVGGSLRVLLASSTTKTGRNVTAEILLKVALQHQQIKKTSNQYLCCGYFSPSNQCLDLEMV
jgi:hypothetical protein